MLNVERALPSNKESFEQLALDDSSFEDRNLVTISEDSLASFDDPPKR